MILAGTMAIFLLSYAITSLFFGNTPERAFRLRRRWIRWIALPTLNIKCIVKGKPPITPALYVCNHRSFSDPLINCAYLDAYVIAKAEIASYPIINKGAEATGVLWVKRNSIKSRSATREKLVETLLKGYNVLVYPEGTVGVTPETLKFSKGTFAEAVKNNIPVVPIALEYRDTKDMWQDTDFLEHYFSQFASWRTEIKMSFGPAMTAADGPQLSLDAHAWINKELKEMQKDWSRTDWNKFVHEVDQTKHLPKS